VVGGRNVIRIGTLRELQCVKKPDGFRFGLAHELAHLGSGDPRTESILAAAYVAGGVFILAGIGRVLVAVVADLLPLMRLGFDVVLFSLRGALPALAPNLISFGVLIALLFAERRSAWRLREFHADAVARRLTGDARWNADDPKAGPKKATGLLARIVAVHPSVRDRRLAFRRVGVAFQADQLLLQLLFVSGGRS
jgi:Zn-dependent protease with chaperone function